MIFFLQTTTRMMHQDRKKNFCISQTINFITLGFKLDFYFISFSLLVSFMNNLENQQNKRQKYVDWILIQQQIKTSFDRRMELKRVLPNYNSFLQNAFKYSQKEVERKILIFASTMAWLSSIYIPIQRTAESFVMVPRSIRLFYPIAFLCPILR